MNAFSPLYISLRFTEELFATLIAFIFIINAFENIAVVGLSTKFAPTTLQLDCKCVDYNETSSFPATKEDCVESGGKLASPGIILIMGINFNMSCF